MRQLSRNSRCLRSAIGDPGVRDRCPSGARLNCSVIHMKYLAKILILAFVFPSLVYATEPVDEKVQTIWIEPGISIGSIKLSTTANELIGQIGPPLKREGLKISYRMEYPLMTFYMSLTNYVQRRLKHVKSEEDLKKIEVKPEDAIIETMITFDSSDRTSVVIHKF